jgi:hypothetical protein
MVFYVNVNAVGTNNYNQKFNGRYKIIGSLTLLEKAMDEN